MWEVLLLLRVWAQPGSPPCGLFGAQFSDLSLVWTEEVPALQSLARFNVTGTSISFTGYPSLRLVFEDEDQSFGFEAFSVGFPTYVEEDTEFTLELCVSIPGPLILPSGLYQCHLYFLGSTGLCVQELMESVAIGTTVPFTVLNTAWLPAVIPPGNSASLLIEGQNNSEDTLNIKECQVEILTVPSQLLDLVACE